MGKKKFIEKKQSATYRLVFKESPSATGGAPGEGTDRVFVRVDGGDTHVPGFDLDTEGDEYEQEERSRGAGHISDNVRQEMLELGFPDDGYNYLQHLREVGTSGRIGSFVPNNRVRLDALHPDVKAFDASKVRVPLSVGESESNALNVSGGAHRIRGPVSKVVDSDVAALLEKEDDGSLVSGDELEDDFVALANEGPDAFSGSSGEEDCRSSKMKIEHWDAKYQSEEEGEEEDDDDNDGGQHERPTRFLDEQFELLALREYDDDEIGELHDDDLCAHGPAHISKFNNIMSDFLINSTFIQDKYQTPAQVKSVTVDSNGGQLELTQGIDKAKESCSLLMSGVDKGNILAAAALEESVSSGEERELILESGSDSDEGRWDCESIVTTYSTLDNHPGKICSFPKASKKSTGQSEDNDSVIRLRGKKQIPLDYLPKRGSLQGDGKSKCFKQGKTANIVKRTEETKEEKKVRKAAIKEEKRSARALKKDMKLKYKDESQRAQRTAAFTGPATLHLG